MATDPDVLRLARAIIELDAHLPRGKDMADHAPRPAWCQVFCEAMDSPGSECCGICGMLSEVTGALDKNFAEDAAWKWRGRVCPDGQWWDMCPWAHRWGG